MTTTTVRVNLQYELEDYNVFTKKKPVIVDMQGVRWDCVTRSWSWLTKQNFKSSISTGWVFCCSISSKKELTEILDKIPDSTKFKFRKEVTDILMAPSY